MNKNMKEWPKQIFVCHKGENSMFKKIIVLVVGAGILSFFTLGHEAKSYFRAFGKTVKESVKREVPVEFEIERARDMVENLLPEIRQSIHVIAEQQVDVEKISKKIAKSEGALTDQKKVILTMRSDLDEADDGTQLVYAGRKYTAEKVSSDLARRFERYKVAKETLEHEKKLLEAHEQVLTANRNKLRSMLGEKRDLELKLARLDARVKSIQAAEAVSALAIDDSGLGRAKKLIQELNTQLDVKEKLLDAEGEFADLIEVETGVKEIPQDIDLQIDTYFQGEEDAEVDQSIVKR